MSDAQPPAGYRGIRPGDELTYRGHTFVCVALIRKPGHRCERGDVCKASWRAVYVLKALAQLVNGDCDET